MIRIASFVPQSVISLFILLGMDFRRPCRHFSIFLSSKFYQSFLLWVLDFTFSLENFTTPSLEGNFPVCICHPTLYLTFKSLVSHSTLKSLTHVKCILACVLLSCKACLHNSTLKTPLLSCFYI